MDAILRNRYVCSSVTRSKQQKAEKFYENGKAEAFCDFGSSVSLAAARQVHPAPRCREAVPVCKHQAHRVQYYYIDESSISSDFLLLRYVPPLAQVRWQQMYESLLFPRLQFAAQVPPKSLISMPHKRCIFVRRCMQLEKYLYEREIREHLFHLGFHLQSHRLQ